MSIKTKAVLVSCHITGPTKTKTDKQASEEVAASKNAARKSTRVVNDLYPKHLISPIEKAEGRARNLLQTGPLYPWKRNQFLLPMEEFMEFATLAGEVELEHSQAVTAFMNNYLNVQAEAQADLGDMYDASVYPDATELRNQFTLVFEYDPVTDDRDFRVQVSEEEEAELRKKAGESAKRRYQRLAEQPAKALGATLEKLITKMLEPERPVMDKKTGTLKEMAAPIFRDTLFENVLSECDLILSFGDDILLPEHVAMARKIKAELPTPKSARSDKSVRDMIAHAAKQWLAELDVAYVPHTPPERAPEPEPADPETLARQRESIAMAEAIENASGEEVAAALLAGGVLDIPEDEQPEPATLQDEHAIAPPDPSVALMADIDAMFADDL